MSLWTRESLWAMRSVDDPTKVIRGQFRPNNVSENIGGNWAEQGTLGLPQPLLQFGGGALETITFEAKVWAFNSGGFNPLAAASLGYKSLEALIDGEEDINPWNADDIKAAVDFIRDMPRPDPSLGRPHVWRLSWTDQFDATVVVQSVGGVRYDHGRQPGVGPKTKGKFTLRGVMFSFTCARYDVPNTDDLITPSESLIYRVKEGDSYESIARLVYGDPNLGDVLRKRTPDKPMVLVGDVLHIPKKLTARREYKPQMVSETFRTGDDQNALVLKHFAERGGAYTARTIRGSRF